LKDRGWVRLVPVFTLPKPGMLRTIEINALTPAGVEVVRELYAQAGRDIAPFSSGVINPVPETILHDLAIRDALIFLTRLLEPVVPIHWFTLSTRSLIQHGHSTMTQAPDLILVAGERQVPLLVEVDLGTESVTGPAANSWETKYARYATYLKRDYGNDPLFEGCAKPLVLVIGPGVRRSRNLASAIAGWGGQRAWWFASLDSLSPLTYQPPGRIWTVPTADEPLTLTEALRLSTRL
jgi:hypothetical protein